ncbi:hypothetical protein [Pseudomonas sp. B35(2017)]|uniref:hypothetical protein n=1 Tax=Pseudomonas sp. B35(2017) TaxID=1981722 RepID=UPI00111C9307|nr:hypothetical protein [Pseudomonas sp. B35(2017)]
MLRVPFTDLPYKPTVDSLLAGLDTEYKDDSFKSKLLKLNPNNKADRETIIKNYIIKDQEHLSYKHKYLLIKELEKAITDKNYDFSTSFEYDYETDEPSASPWPADEIDTPRGFLRTFTKSLRKPGKQIFQRLNLKILQRGNSTTKNHQHQKTRATNNTAKENLTQLKILNLQLLSPTNRAMTTVRSTDR